jgi:hypothetical protein
MIGPVGVVHIDRQRRVPPRGELVVLSAGSAELHQGDHHAVTANAPPYAPGKIIQYETFSDGTFILLCGQLYNDRQQGLTDPAVVYEYFRDKGPDGFATLNGSFALFLHDGESGADYLATDRLATWPILFARTDSTFYFAPVLEAFSDVPGVSRQLNETAIATLFASGHMYGAATYLRDVQSLGPGKYLRISDQTLDESEYWRFGIRDDATGQDPVALQRGLRDLLIRAVERRRNRHSDAPILMSGGADSRALLGCLLEMGDKPRLYSYAADRAHGSDASVAEQIAKAFGCPFEYLPYKTDDILDYVHQSTRPYSCLRSSIYEYRALDRLRNACDAVWLGDESFGWHGHALETEDDVLAAVGIQPLDANQAWRQILTPDAFEKLVEHDRAERAAASQLTALTDLHNRKDFLYTAVRLPRNILLGRRYLAANVATPLAPWLDADILDFIACTTVPMRLSKKLFRETAEASFPLLFELPGATGLGMPAGYRWFQRAQANDPRIVEHASIDGDSPIDAWLDAAAIRAYFDQARPSLLQSIRTAIMESPVRPAAQYAAAVSRKLRQRSSSYARQRRGAGFQTLPHLVLERIAQARFYTSEILNAETDEPFAGR